MTNWYTALRSVSRSYNIIYNQLHIRLYEYLVFSI